MGVIALLAPSTAIAQSDTAYSTQLPPLIDEAREIALARSAAPDAVSAEATVLVLRRGGYAVAVEGTNGVTCYVSRSRPESLEPHCFDQEGSETILAMQLRRAELREQAKSREDIEQTLARELADGTFRLPSRPAMSYMMSGGQVLYNEEGQHVGKWRPHLMIYVPFITSEQLGLYGAPSTEAAIVVDSGKPTANIMVVVESFVEPTTR
jgi:hypothetical protein